MPDSINLEPTDEGYANIARFFAGQVISDMRVARQKASRELLVGLIEVAGYLAVKDPEKFKALLADIKGK